LQCISEDTQTAELAKSTQTNVLWKRGTCIGLQHQGKLCIGILTRDVKTKDQDLMTQLFKQDMFHPMDFLLFESTRQGIALAMNCFLGEISSLHSREEDTIEITDEEELVAHQAKASMECKYQASMKMM
jgi:hypothetical protein